MNMYHKCSGHWVYTKIKFDVQYLLNRPLNLNKTR